MKKLMCISIMCVLFGSTAFAQSAVQPDIPGEDTTRSEKSETNSVIIQDRNDTVRSEVSTLWTVVMIDMLYADVLGLYIPEVMDEFTEFADGREADLMLAGAIGITIPISMIYLSKVLNYKAFRIANYVGAGITAAFVIGGGSTDSHYLVLAASEIVCLTLITLKTMKWSGAEGERESISFRMAPTKGGATAALTWRF